LALLRAKPMKLPTLVEKLSKEFPDRDVDTLERTTKRRLSGYLQAKFGIEIEKSKKGTFSITG
jgi:hypothetical protein